MPEAQQIVLRAAGPSDADELSLLGAATFLETFSGFLAGADILAHCRQQHAAMLYESWLADPRYALCLAELNGAPVGFAVLSPPDLPIALTAADIELKRIYLLHRFQGNRLGRRLVEWASENAQLMKKQRLLLGVKADNHAAIAFYERVGFVRIGERKFQVGSMLCDDYLFAKPL